MKANKGQPGYIAAQRKRKLVRTILLFVLVFAVFSIGLYLNGGERKNIFSIIAAVLCIPAAMSATGTIVLYTLHPGDREIRQTAAKVGNGIKVLYELYVTTREKSLLIDAAALTNDAILAFSSAPNASVAKTDLEQYLLMQTEGLLPGIEVRIETEFSHFLKQLESLSSTGDPDDMEIIEELTSILLALSM